MSFSARTRARTTTWSVSTAAAMAAALIAAPALTQPAHASATSAGLGAVSTPGVHLVTLLTGDRVVVRTDAAGRVAASLTPGSPDFGHRVESAALPGHTWIVPELSPSVRGKLDPSVFDVAALSRSSQVPLRVTFKAGTSPRSLPGISVRTGTARSAGRGRTSAEASYDARRPLPASLMRSLGSVSRISLRGVPAVTAAPGYELHTLTINGTTASGSPLPGADVFVMNTDDGRLFGAFGGIIDGQWKVSVPSGHYLVLVSDFDRLVVSQPVVGSADATDSVSMAAATVKPRSTFPDHRSLGASLDLVGTDAAGIASFDFGFGGGPLPKLNPVAAATVGSLATEVGNQWSKPHYTPYVFTPHGIVTHPLTYVANAKVVRDGIPSRLDFRFRPSDFGSATIRHSATGRKTRAFDGWAGFSPRDQVLLLTTLPTLRPGVVHAQFAGDRDISWLSNTSASTSFRNFTELDDIHRHHPGDHTTVAFFRAPVTPVADRGDESGYSGPFCSLCVTDGVVHGFLSMMSSAGTDQRGFASTGSWALYRKNGSRLDRGHGQISPVVKGVLPGQQVVLTAQTGREAAGWQLSSKVLDRWSVAVPAQNGVLPILRADYVPPTNLASRGPVGQVSFPITFDNLGPVDARVRSAQVQYSTNGRTWHGARLTRKDRNTFRVSYPDPTGTPTHPFLSLRVFASDVAGRAVAEQVDNAYLLPTGRPVAHHAATTPTHRNRFRASRLCRTAGVHQVTCYVKLDGRTLSAGRSTPDPAGWGAPALRDAYDVPVTSSTQTVAVVVPFDYPSAEADMNHYRAQFGLPACTSASGCFTKINQNGKQGPYPFQDYGWGVEASLDLQMISAACPTCHIVLAEARTPDDESLGKATMAAIHAGAKVTNHSYGRIELTGTELQDGPYDQPGVTAVSSTGDFGYGPASFPASSPQVVAVGGTTLARSATAPRGWIEKVWSFAGSGCSAYFAKPGFQTDPSCHGRTDADVSAIAQGLAIYNTSLPRGYRGWLTVDGTSASSPFVAGLIGAANAGGLKPADLYGHPGDFNDVVRGSNGFCQGNYLCTGVAGYDGPTGWGTPNGLAPFEAP